MKLKQFLGAAVMATAGASASANVVLSEGFDDVTTLAGSGWVANNLSTPIGATGWFQGNSDVFSAAGGAANAYIAANYLNADSGGTISNWLLTPEVSLGPVTTLAFQARVAGDDFLDTLEVYFSGNGASTSLSDFSLLGSYASTTGEGWVSQSFGVANGGSSGRFAFRYFVGNTLIDGNYVGIDSVIVRTAANAVPLPGTLALAGLALGMLGVTRRKLG